MRSSSSTSTDIIDIAAKTQRLDVDNRISIRYYFRIANNILRQADIFRAEKNIIDLYVMLLRFSSLVSETIPCHRGYRAFPQNNKDYLRKKLLISLTELEELKPVVQKKIDELNRRQARQLNGWGHDHQNDVLEWPPVRKKSPNNYGVTKAVTPVARQSVHQGSRIQLQLSHVRPVEEQFHRITLNYPRPKEDTLSRHSILGANGLSGQWQPPRINEGIKYPSITDLTPIEIPSLQQSRADELPLHSDSNGAEPQKPSSESIISVDNVKNTGHTDEPDALISFETTEIPVQTEIIRQPSPPPVLAEVQDLIPAMSQAPETEHAVDISSPIDLARSESPLQLHISTTMMETFMKLAKSNTNKNLETCGVLAGLLKNRKFYVTALIIPKQESTSDTCHTTNEEEIFEVQDKRSLFPLGWIHTHPTQSCFMSSVDVHTHYSYQIMLPESVAIVMAPKDISRTHGIFRLTTPGGMSVIRQCQQRGFHSHEPPSDGGPIYKACTDVYMNPNLNFEVIDLRGC